jgi:RNA polymerase sigma-70 factor (family 1)
MSNEEFNKIFIEYYNKLCAFAYHYIQDREATEDVVQDVFCHLIERHQEIRQESLSTFLFQCTRNKALDYLKNAHNQQETIDGFQELSELDTFFDDMIINRPEVEYDYQVLLDAVRSLVATLPDKTREVFLMSRRQQMSNKEIAAALNISVKTVEKHITKSLSFLRTRLTEEKLITFLILLTYCI